MTAAIETEMKSEVTRLFFKAGIPVDDVAGCAALNGKNRYDFTVKLRFDNCSIMGLCEVAGVLTPLDAVVNTRNKTCTLVGVPVSALNLEPEWT